MDDPPRLQVPSPVVNQAVTPPGWSWPPPWYPARPPDSPALGVFKVIALGTASFLLIALALGALAGIVLLTGTILSATSAIGGATTGLNGSLASARSAVTTAGQNLTDIADPTHPPREAIVADTEFDALRKLK